MAAVAAARQRHGAVRIGLVLGTSASTIGVSEQAYAAITAGHYGAGAADVDFDRDGGFPPSLRSESLNSMHAVTAFVQEALALQGPCATVSTACSSSAKAFAQAERWLRLGLTDAVVVAGVDALCGSVLFGFAALQLLSPEPCQPFSALRRGISVGEAAGFALLERAAPGTGALQLLGYGESNDAHHMSTPHPQGAGAERALDAALARAGLAALGTDTIDFVHLHGTGTPRNDEVESALVARRYRSTVHASATKGLTGHTMGAAGIVGALVSLLALRQGLCAGTPQTTAADPAMGAVFARQLRLQPTTRGMHAVHGEQGVGDVRVAASHSFGFGGNNCVLLFGRDVA
jgi:3-oxoacyl-[acyl-carrier-protein] synthase I